MPQDVDAAEDAGANQNAHGAAGPRPRALLPTDVVDGTAVSERLGDAAMAAAWAAHDRVARDLLLFDAVADARHDVRQL
jgi:class 3 adenylate cyclase